MSKLFRHDRVYPQDDVGAYVELTGPVVAVRDGGADPMFRDGTFGRSIAVDVDVDEYGVFTGYTNLFASSPKLQPRVGDSARIRIYNAGGGWYHDNKIVGWTREG